VASARSGLSFSKCAVRKPGRCPGVRDIEGIDGEIKLGGQVIISKFDNTLNILRINACTTAAVWNGTFETADKALTFLELDLGRPE
jgi:hypothetical protein